MIPRLTLRVLCGEMQMLMPLERVTAMVFSIHNLFLNNQGCAGEVKNVAKLRSGSLMIECFRKQHL
jgi:hypothetical protein